MIPKQRPVTAIFVHPEDRYYVVYQNGRRYKVSRMKLDKTSWERRKPYTGSDDKIFLLKDKVIEDADVAKLLPTYEWPHSRKGRSLTFFLSWWEHQGYSWLMKHHPLPYNQAEDTGRNSAVPNKTVTQANSTYANQKVNAPSALSLAENAKENADNDITLNIAPTDTHTSDDLLNPDSLFDDMLLELNSEIESSS